MGFEDPDLQVAVLDRERPIGPQRQGRDRCLIAEIDRSGERFRGARVGERSPQLRLRIEVRAGLLDEDGGRDIPGGEMEPLRCRGMKAVRDRDRDVELAGLVDVVEREALVAIDSELLRRRAIAIVDRNQPGAEVEIAEARRPNEAIAFEQRRVATGVDRRRLVRDLDLEVVGSARAAAVRDDDLDVVRAQRRIGVGERERLARPEVERRAGAVAEGRGRVPGLGIGIGEADLTAELDAHLGRAVAARGDHWRGVRRTQVPQERVGTAVGVDERHEVRGS